MNRVSEPALREVEAALQKYSDLVRGTSLSEDSKHTYLLHAENFVRWLRSEFDPGARKAGLSGRT